MPEVNKLASSLAAQHDDLRTELKASLMRRGASVEDAEDIVSATIATVLSLPDERIGEVENLRAYLHAVARNMHAKHGRDLSRNEPRDHVDLERGVAERGFSSIEDEQTRGLVVRAFKQLPARAREVLWQVIVEERSSREIASRLGITVTSVTTQTQRAKVALRQAYVTEFIALTPPQCGLKPEVLARIVTGKATKRDREKYLAHTRSCDSCPKLAAAAREEATWVHSLIALIGLGGLAGGALAGTADKPVWAASAVTARRVLGAASVAVCLACAFFWLFATVTESPLTSGEELALSLTGVAPPGVTADEEVDARTLRVTVTPERLALPMPAAGGQEHWGVVARSDSSVEGHLLAAARLSTVSYDSQPARLALTVRPAARPARAAANAPAVSPAWLSGAATTAAQYLYLGTIQPGETFAADGSILRNANDTDPTAAARTDVEFLLVDAVPDGTRVGDELARLPEGSEALAATGADRPQAAAPLGALLITTGAFLVLTATCRANAGGRRADRAIHVSHGRTRPAASH